MGLLEITLSFEEQVYLGFSIILIVQLIIEAVLYYYFFVSSAFPSDYLNTLQIT